jgi:hypothetical protein
MKEDSGRHVLSLARFVNNNFYTMNYLNDNMSSSRRLLICVRQGLLAFERTETTASAIVCPNKKDEVAYLESLEHARCAFTTLETLSIPSASTFPSSVPPPLRRHCLDKSQVLCKWMLREKEIAVGSPEPCRSGGIFIHPPPTAARAFSCNKMHASRRNANKISYDIRPNFLYNICHYNTHHWHFSPTASTTNTLSDSSFLPLYQHPSHFA